MYVQLPRRRLVIVTGALMVSMLFAGLDGSMVLTAMPRIVAELAGIELYPWVTTANLAGMVTMIPISGRLGDLFGRKRFLLGGLVGLVCASALCGLAQNMIQLVVLRGVQGICAGFLASSTQSTLADVFSPATRVRMQGIFASMFAVAAVAGPTFGGFITDAFGWRWVFYANVPLGLAAITAVTLALPSLRPGGSRSDIDVVGAVLLATGVVPALVALSILRDHALASPLVLGLLVCSVLSVVAFTVVERRHSHPIIPFWLFRNGVFVVSILASGLAWLGLHGAGIFLPLVYMGVLGVSATHSGLLLGSRMIAMVFASIVIGQVLTMIPRYRYVGTLGLGFIVAGLVLLSRVDTSTGELEVVRDTALLGIGHGMIQPIYQNALLSAVPRAFVGIAASQLQFWRVMGQTVGAAALGSVFAHQLPLETSARIGGPGTTALVSAGGLDAEALFSPARIAVLREALGPGGLPQLDEVLLGVRAGLAASLGSVFLLAAVMVAIAMVISTRLEEVPFTRSEAAGEPKSALTDGAQ